MPHKRKPWSPERKKRYLATMLAKRDMRQSAAKPSALSTGDPVIVLPVIYIQVNGHLKRFVLRNMPVYVPAEELGQ